MTPPADLRLLAGTRQGRVVDVALGTAAIEGLGFERSERGALLQALDQIRIADKGATEGKQVRLALGQSTAGQRQVITVIGQIGLLEAPTQGGEVEWGDIPGAAGGTLDHVQVDDAQRTEPLDEIVVLRLGIAAGDAIGR